MSPSQLRHKAGCGDSCVEGAEGEGEDEKTSSWFKDEDDDGRVRTRDRDEDEIGPCLDIPPDSGMQVCLSIAPDTGTFRPSTVPQPMDVCLSIAPEPVEPPLAIEKLGAQHLTISGGEPLLRKDGLHLVPTTQLITNGSHVDADMALGPRARATESGGARWVATSLDEAPEHVLLRVLHEEMRPLTDPVVLSDWEGPSRDTRLGTEGYALHEKMESVAIGATHVVLEAWAPEHLLAFQRWLERLGLE